MRAIQAITALALAAGLAACGDGSSAEPAPPMASNEVPASATASTASFSQYAGSVKPSETTDPLTVDKVQPPTSETEEPVSIP
jgi:hypothetical protein